MSMVILVSSVLACVVLSTTAAAPTHETTLSMDLKLVMDKSVCPIRVRIDEDEHRIPRRIKMLECAATPNPMCRKEGVTHACCHSHHHAFHTQCVQVTDGVRVRYSDRDDDQQLHLLTVAVGCACMVREHTPALEDPPPTS